MTSLDADRARGDADRGQSKATKVSGLSDVESSVAKARDWAIEYCKREWSKDGILRLEGMMSLRSHIKASVTESSRDEIYDLMRTPRPSEDVKRARMEVYLSYLNKGAKEYAVTDKKKESHIRLLIECCMNANWKFGAEKCKEALVSICLEGGVWGEYAAKALHSNISKYDSNPAVKDGMDPVILCVDVLDRLGMDVSQLCMTHWKKKAIICAKFVGDLLKKDRQHARRVALVGLDLFPSSSLVAAKALDAVDGDCDGDVMLRVWCAMYVTHMDTEYYEKARTSASWSKVWAQKLAVMLAAQELFDEELEVLDDAGLDGEMLAAFVHDGTVHAAVRYKERMIKDHPHQYYEMCYRLADDILDRRRDLGADTEEEEKEEKRKPDPKALRQNNDDIQTCLQMMKDIPGHEVQFKEFCSELLCDSDTDSDLVRILKDASITADA